MTDSLLIAFAAGIGGMLGWGLADFFAKITIDKVGAIRSLVWAHIFGTFFYILFICTKYLIDQQAVIAPSSNDISGLFFFGALQMVVYWLAYEGFGKGFLAVLNPIFASYSGLVALISVVFLGEQISNLLLFSLILMFIGVILINTDFSDLRDKKVKITLGPGVKEVVAAAILAAVWTIGWDKFVSGDDAITYSFGMYFFMSISAIILALAMRIKFKMLSKRVLIFPALIGLCEVLAYVSITWGFSATDRTSVVALISGAFSLPTVVLAYFFLKEKITRIQIIAVCIIIFSLIIVAGQ